jgi:hypothetical protein
VKLVGAALGDDVDLSAAAAAVFRGGVAGLDFELLNGIHGRQNRVLINREVVVVHAIEKEVVGLLASAIDADGTALRGVLRAVGGKLGARNQKRERQEVAFVERKLAHFLLVDDLANRRRVCLKKRSRFCDRNLLAYLADQA